MAGDINLLKLIRHKSFLEEIIDPDTGLLDELLRCKTLTRKEFDYIKAEKDPYYNRNAKLLEHITDQGKFDSFVTALRNTKQEHVVNYLMADGAYRSEFGLIWPLTEYQTTTIDFNQGILVELIDTSELVERLFSNNVINRRQKITICSENNESKRNEIFLEFLLRGSQSNFHETINWLIETMQANVANILLKGGVAVKVHAKTDADAKREREIAEICMRIISERSYEERMRSVEQLMRNIIAAKQGDSIVFYVLCQTPEQWEELRMSVEVGTFRKSVEWFINEVSPCRKKTKILDIEIKHEEFTGVQKRVEAGTWGSPGSNSTNKEIDLIPLEIQDIILQKAYLYNTLQENRTRLSSQAVISQLSSVNFCWCHRFRDRHFKTSTWRKLLEFYRSQKQRHAVILNNAHYLKSLSLSPFEMNRLKSADCITDAQAASIQRRRLKHFQGSRRLYNLNFVLDICNILKSVDDGRYSSFLRCIRQTKKRSISKLVENGGVIVKVDLKERNEREKMPAKLPIKSNLIKRLNAVLNGKTLETFEDNRLLNKLRKDDLEILAASLNKNIVCWIWCRSHEGFEKIQHPDKRKAFVEAFAGLLKAPSGQRFKMNVDYEHYNRAMVSFSTCVHSTKMLEYEKSQCAVKVHGITQLGNYIYTVCDYSSHIYVFDSQNEFCLLDKIMLGRINYPGDIGSSQREDCLYITDPLERCVWKVKEETDKYEYRIRKITKFLETGIDFKPSNLSVSSDGELVMVNFNWPHHLRVYDPDARRCLSILFPEGIAEIRHAVKAANGNFFISHVLFQDIESADNAEIDELFCQLKSIYRRPSRKQFESNKNESADEEQTTDVILETEVCWTISEWSGDGKNLIRLFIPENQEQKLRDPRYLSIGLCDRLFVADTGNDRIILLNSDLKWNQILFPREKEESVQCRNIPFLMPNKILYDEKNKNLVAGSLPGSAVFTLTTKCKTY